MLKISNPTGFRILGVVLFSVAVATVAGSTTDDLGQRVTLLEAEVRELNHRLAKLERTADQPAAPAESAKPIQRTVEAVSGWLEQDPWREITPGLSPEDVVKILGQPTRTVRSLKPKVDLVFYYEGTAPDSGAHLRGKVSFRKGAVIEVVIPDFE